MIPTRRTTARAAAPRAVAACTFAFLVALVAACPSRAHAVVGGKVPPAFLARLAADARLGLIDTTPPPRPLMMAHIVGAVSHARHPRVVYVGAEYCPFCAALRWPLVLTLLRFGDLRGLRFMRSSPTDVFADPPTLSFYHARYAAPAVILRAYETATRFGAPLQRVPHAVNELFDAYDAPPFTEDAGAIPFLYLNGLYVVSGSPVSPGLFDGKTWGDIARALGDPRSKMYRTVMPVANALSAAVCAGMSAPPRRVCGSPGVALARHALPHG